MSNIWHWPFPNNVPWELPLVDGNQITLDLGIGCPIHAPFDGTIETFYDGPEYWICPALVGEPGILLFSGASKTCLKDTVKAGDSIGHTDSLLVLTLVPRDLIKPQWSVENPDLKDHALPGLREQLIKAWTLVTPRFHRDAPRPPREHDKRRDMIAWLQRHPLWTHPVTIQVPPEYDKRDPDASGYFETREDGYSYLRDSGPDWITKVIDDGGGSYHECIESDFIYVDPTCEYVMGKGAWYSDPRNSAFRVWIEAGGWGDSSLEPYFVVPEEGWNDHNRWHRCHDINLDCGAATLEESLVQLALRVQWYYGDTREQRVQKDCGFEEVPCDCASREGDSHHLKSSCENTGDGFCRKCGYLIDEYTSQFAQGLTDSEDA